MYLAPPCWLFIVAFGLISTVDCILRPKGSEQRIDLEAVSLAASLARLDDNPHRKQHIDVRNPETLDKINKALMEQERLLKKINAYEDLVPPTESIFADYHSDANAPGRDALEADDLDHLDAYRSRQRPTLLLPEAPDAVVLPSREKPTGEPGVTPIVNFKFNKPIGGGYSGHSSLKKGPEKTDLTKKLMSGKFLKSKMKKAYKMTKESVTTAVVELPKYVNQATDVISTKLKLDNKGKLNAMIEEVQEDIRYVLKEFSSFSMTWSPLMTRALNYIGDTNLNVLRYGHHDDLDFSKDALTTLVFGYEFMRIMMTWRENLVIAHEAYKTYLEGLVKDLANPEGQRFEVDEEFTFNLQTVHNYYLLISWKAIEEAMRESKMKLDHLMAIEDDRMKNYENEFFRAIVVFQEIYEPTMEQFEEQYEEVSNEIVRVGAETSDFAEVDKLYHAFRDSLLNQEITTIEWDVPQALKDFMDKIKPELQFNPIVYKKGFLRELLNDRERREQERD